MDARPKRFLQFVVIGLLSLTVATVARAADPAPTITTLTVIPDQNFPNQILFKLSTSDPPTDARWFRQPNAPGADISRYKIYDITNSNNSLVKAADVTSDYVAPGGKIAVSYVDGASLPLAHPLRSDHTYLIEVKDAGGQNQLDLTITASPTIVLQDVQHQRNALYVNANVPITMPDPVVVMYNPGVGPLQPFPAHILGVRGTLGFAIWVDEDLPAGQANPLQLSIGNVKDSYGTVVPVSGSVASAASAPTDVTKDFISIALSAIAATHTAPTFSAIGAFAPLHIAKNSVAWHSLHVDPSITFNTGSANAKTSNSVILPSQFIRPFLFGLPHNPSNDPAPKTLQELDDLTARDSLEGDKPSSVNVMNAMGGLRAEFDTQYGGTNLAAEGRLEWYLSALYGTAARRTAKVAMANPSVRSTLNLPTNGFSVTPYLQYDGGGHVTSQSIVNSTAGQPNASVPTYAISRIYFGSQATLQISRNTFALDGYWVELFKPETVPFTQGSNVLTRAISGLQPHAKGTYNISIDQEGHFAGSIAWENGRSAPTFQYLNKVTVGVQVTY
jgi:hypothetical protein